MSFQPTNNDGNPEGRMAECDHEVDPASLKYHRLGREGVCRKCGKRVFAVHYVINAARAPKVHRSKKDRKRAKRHGR